MRLVKFRGKWAAYIDGKRYSTGLDHGTDRSLAERKARDILAALTTPAGRTSAEILSAYIADMPRRATPKTPTSGLLCAAHAVGKFFGDHEPAAVTREECRVYIARRRAEGRSDGTIRKELGVLATALRWADPNTPAVFEMPAVPPPRDRWLTKEELRRLLALDDLLPHLRTFIHVAICTGARREAVLNMKWETHIDFARNTIWPGFKAGGKRRAMPIPMTIAAREWLEEASTIAGTPWLIEWAGAPVKDVKTGLRAAYRRAGIADIKAPAHVLRHTAGAHMAIDGVPLLEIAQRLGHSSVSVTERHYAHLSPEYLTKSTKALEL